MRGSVNTWNRWVLITLRSYYAELWKHTRTRADANGHLFKRNTDQMRNFQLKLSASV